MNDSVMTTQAEHFPLPDGIEDHDEPSDYEFELTITGPDGYERTTKGKLIQLSRRRELREIEDGAAPYATHEPTGRRLIQILFQEAEE